MRTPQSRRVQRAAFSRRAARAACGTCGMALAMCCLLRTARGECDVWRSGRSVCGLRRAACGACGALCARSRVSRILRERRIRLAIGVQSLPRIASPSRVANAHGRQHCAMRLALKQQIHAAPASCIAAAIQYQGNPALSSIQQQLYTANHAVLPRAAPRLELALEKRGRLAMAERPELSSMCFGFGGCEWRAKSAKLAASKMRCEVRLGKLRAACDMRRAYGVRHATVCRVLEVCF
jgi:hypothetical protein